MASHGFGIIFIFQILTYQLPRLYPALSLIAIQKKWADSNPSQPIFFEQNLEINHSTTSEVALFVFSTHCIS